MARKWTRTLFCLSGNGQVVYKLSSSQRRVYRFELELSFRAAGFARWSILGGLDARPLKAPDDQMIAWAFKA